MLLAAGHQERHEATRAVRVAEVVHVAMLATDREAAPAFSTDKGSERPPSQSPPLSVPSGRMVNVIWANRHGQPMQSGGPYDGVPSWLRIPVHDWLQSALQSHSYDSSEELEIFKIFDLMTQRSAPLAAAYQAYRTVSSVLSPLSEEDLLDLVEFCLRMGLGSAERLEAQLSLGGSLWKVIPEQGHHRLLRRVPEGVQVAVSDVVSQSGDAGRLLAEAWSAAYGRAPDPAGAYDKAIKAVEAASTPVVKSTDTTASLSKVIGQMRSDGNWTVALDKEHKQNPLQKVLLDMMQALMSGHSDRHPGTPGYVATTREAASAAVGLAVTLVQWFSSGAVRRVDPSGA